MAEPRHAVLRDFSSPGEAGFHDALIAGLSRVAAQIGRGTLADRSHRTTRSLDMLFAGETTNPGMKGGFDFLIADDTALDEVLALYGFALAPRRAARGPDMATVADMAGALARFADALSDGSRNHNETLALAALLRPLMLKLAAIVDEADALRAPSI